MIVSFVIEREPHKCIWAEEEVSYTFSGSVNYLIPGRVWTALPGVYIPTAVEQNSPCLGNFDCFEGMSYRLGGRQGRGAQYLHISPHCEIATS